MMIVYHCAIQVNGKWEELIPIEMEVDIEKLHPFDLMKQMLKQQKIEYYLISYEERG